jgi:hypothetical protein
MKSTKEPKGSGAGANIPPSKRGTIKLSHPELTNAISRYHNEDTILAEPTSGVGRTRRVAGTNSSKTNRE